MDEDYSESKKYSENENDKKTKTFRSYTDENKEPLETLVCECG
jgi:hypothetical protein